MVRVLKASVGISDVLVHVLALTCILVLSFFPLDIEYWQDVMLKRIKGVPKSQKIPSYSSKSSP